MGHQADVEVRNITKRFGHVVAVDNVSLHVTGGEFFSILGPSGSGKSTLLRILSGLEFPDQGDIYVEGQCVTHVPAYARPSNMVFQQLALFPHLNVFKNVAFGLRMARVPRRDIDRRVQAVLEMVRMVNYESRRISQLSGGQQQRVAIARALVNEPRVLFLDEPLGALDLKLRLQLQVDLKKLQQRVGSTFIYVTHDQTEAMNLSDRIAVMNEGRVMQIGTPAEVYERPRTTFVAKFIGETNLIEGKVEQDGGQFLVVRAGDVAIKVRNPDLPVTPGMAIHLFLRPERIAVGPSAKALDNTFTGKVAEVSYLGSLFRYQVLIGDLRLTVHLPSMLHERHYAPGTDICLGWRSTEVGVVTD